MHCQNRKCNARFFYSRFFNSTRLSCYIRIIWICHWYRTICWHQNIWIYMLIWPRPEDIAPRIEGPSAHSSTHDHSSINLSLKLSSADVLDNSIQFMLFCLSYLPLLWLAGWKCLAQIISQMGRSHSVAPLRSHFLETQSPYVALIVQHIADRLGPILKYRYPPSSGICYMFSCLT